MKLAKWLATGLLALMGVVLVLEVAFRVGGAVVAGDAPASSDGATVILCVGDSHTRGRPDPDNYPAALQRLLDERAEGRWRVLNVGVPGMNTAQVRSRFPRYLAYYRPAIVLHWAGINNFWNHAERGRTSLLDRVLELSRIARVVRVGLFYRGLRVDPGVAPAIAEHKRLGAEEYDIGVNFGGTIEEIRGVRAEDIPAAEVETLTGEDLGAMIDAARERGARLYPIAYSFFWGGYYQPVNAAVRTAAERRGIPFVAAGAALPGARAEAQGAPLFDDWVHPMPVLYRHIALEVYRTLVRDGAVRPKAGAAP